MTIQTIYRQNRILIKEMKKVQRLPVAVKAIQMESTFNVETPFGWFKGKKGDWILREVTGQFYLIRKTLFKRTYKVLDE